MKSLTIAKRYAKALVEIGKEDGKLEKYGQELAAMVALLDQAPELDSVLANPAIDSDSRQKVLGAVLAKAELSPMVNNFLRLLMERKRINEIRNIDLVYSRLTDEVKGITRAEVFSATPLNDEDQTRLKSVLQKMAGTEVQIEVKQEANLIGGVVARIGDLVLDGSVKTQLESLKDSLRRGEYA